MSEYPELTKLNIPTYNKNHKIETTDRWQEYHPGTITQNNDVTTLWDKPIKSDSEMNPTYMKIS